MGGCRSGLPIDLDTEYLGGTECVRHQVCRLIGPGDDIDSLGSQLADDTADPHAPRADASADRVDAVLGRRHRDLGSHPRFPGQGADDDGARHQLGDLELQQTSHQRLVCPRDGHLGAAAALTFLQQEDLEVLADPDRLVRDLLLRRQHALRLAQLQVHGVTVRALCDPLHDPAHHLTLVLENVPEHLVLLGIAQPLEDHLLTDLGRQASEVLRRQWHVDHVAKGCASQLLRVVQTDLGRRILGSLDDPTPAEDRDLRGVGIDVHPNAFRRIERPPVGGRQRRFHQVEERLLGDPLLLLDLIEGLDEV